MVRVLWQAISVIRQTPRLPEAAGPRSGRAGSGPPLRVLVLGDSSAAGVGAARQDDALTGQLAGELSQHFAVDWRLVARTGWTTRSTLRALGTVVDRFDVAVTALGVNDVTRLVSPRHFARQQAMMVDALTALGCRSVYASALPPMERFPALPAELAAVLGRRARALDAVLNDLARARADVTHVTPDLPLDPSLMASDGFHPGPGLYAMWARALATRIREDLTAPGQSLPGGGRPRR